MIDVAGNCRQILERIGRAAVRCGRSPDSVRLVAVTKTVAVEDIKKAIGAGLAHFGENRVQEALPKIDALAGNGLTWHFIGHLQTNKAKKVATSFDWVHSIDRIEAADALLRGLPPGKVLPVLLEVKTDPKHTKSGVAPEMLPELVAWVESHPELALKGLMTIPPPFDDPESARPHFRRLRQLAEEFHLPELSMGMTNDFEVAIEEGATMVRIGTAIFGPRQ